MAGIVAAATPRWTLHRGRVHFPGEDHRGASWIILQEKRKKTRPESQNSRDVGVRPSDGKWRCAVL
eukprot:9280999-Pyramimonas_sp.AAC.1